MPITRINHFEAKPGSEQALFAFLQSIVPLVQSAPGCVSVKLLRGTLDTKRFVLIEEWESIEAHREAAKAIPPQKFTEMAPLAAKPPTGTYFS